MLEDRPYMRQDYRGGGRFRLDYPATYILTGSLVLAYLFQMWDRANGGRFFELLALSTEGISHGYFWQLLTFQFLHASPGHLLANVVFGLWMIGRPVEERLGVRHFLTIYFVGGVVGGLLQVALGFLFPGTFGGYVVGASAGIMGLTAALAMADPDLQFLLFFVIPMRAANLLYLIIGFSLVCLGLGFSMPQMREVAHGAHLGGILFAMAYMRLCVRPFNPLAEWNPWRKKMRETLRPRIPHHVSTSRFGRSAAQSTPSSAMGQDEFMSHEVDPILDKISAHGIQSLSDRERKILQAARARMSKR